MTPKWWWTRKQVLAQLARWEAEKDLWLHRSIAVAVHNASSWGMERARIIAVLKAAVKTMEAMG